MKGTLKHGGAAPEGCAFRNVCSVGISLEPRLGEPQTLEEHCCCTVPASLRDKVTKADVGRLLGSVSIN